jgi:hypothetical protein
MVKDFRRYHRASVESIIPGAINNLIHQGDCGDGSFRHLLLEFAFANRPHVNWGIFNNSPSFRAD